MTPFFQNENIEIYHCPCGSGMKERLEDGSIDLTVTSPPYDSQRKYNGFYFDFKIIAAELWRVTKPGGVLVWIVADQTKDGTESGTSFEQALYFRSLGFNIHDTMIYRALGTGAKGSRLSYWQAFEFMFVLSKGRPKSIHLIQDVKNKTIGMKRGGRFREGGAKERLHGTSLLGIRTNVWDYHVGFMDKSDKLGHPAPFPEDLAKDHILSWSDPGDLILDPMMGSGTTLKMANILGRKSIGFDISEDYCRMAVTRITK